MIAVYKISNTYTNDIYIGSSVDFQRRQWEHLHDLRKRKHHSQILQNSWNKYGEGAFLFSVVEEVSAIDILLDREQHWIDLLLPRYNTSRVAGSPLGVKHTAESRLNMSLAHQGKKLSVESIAKRTETVLGGKRSIKTRQRMSDSSKKISITQYSLDGNIIKVWVSSVQAAKELNIGQAHITSCCKGKRKTIGGFIWKYTII